MAAIEHRNPLLLPLILHERTYLTSQKIHQDYLANAKERQEKIKHRSHSHFRRVIAEIPSYPLLIEQKDIVVLTWKSFKASKDIGNQILVSCFKALYYNPLILLTATAQMELAHHLDDELNQEMAYRNSQQGARREDNTTFAGILRQGPVKFRAKFKGAIATHLNTLNALTRQGRLKHPQDMTGSDRVQGIVPTRIKEGYEATIGEEHYAEAKKRAKQTGAKATHQVVEDIPLDMMRGMMYMAAITAMSESHYCDLIDFATGEQQIAMRFRFPQLPEDDGEREGQP